MFDIYLTEDIVEESEGHAVYGRIRLGDYTETFIASLLYWSPVRYARHWHVACERLVQGMDVSVLISSYVPETESEFLVWWPLYKVGEIIYVRNEILAYSQLDSTFSEGNPWSSIRERRVLTDEGLEISEWDIHISDLRDFLSRGNP